MTRTTCARRRTTGRLIAAGGLSLPLALVMIGPAASTEPTAAQSTTLAANDDGRTCDQLGYSKFDSESGSETVAGGVKLVWSGRTLTYTIPEGYTVELCVKGGSTLPIETFTRTSSGSYTHPQGISHIGYVVTPTPTTPPTTPPPTTPPPTTPPPTTPPPTTPPPTTPPPTTPPPTTPPPTTAADPDPAVDAAGQPAEPDPAHDASRQPGDADRRRQRRWRHLTDPDAERPGGHAGHAGRRPHADPDRRAADACSRPRHGRPDRLADRTAPDRRDHLAAPGPRRRPAGRRRRTGLRRAPRAGRLVAAPA